MNTAVQVGLMLAATSTAGIAGSVPEAQEFRVASMLFTGAVAGVIIGIAISENETKRRLFTRAAIALCAGPGIIATFDYYSSWIDLTAFPYLMIGFFGVISSLACFFVGYAFVKKVKNSEDDLAARTMAETIGKAEEIKKNL